MALLEVDDISIGYNTQKGYLKAVEGVSFSLEQGQSLGLVGESGCGKTTIGMALMGLLPPNGSVRKGRILLEGRNILDMSDEEKRHIRWREMAMIFQAAMNA
ncbi:MAG: ATP-binding cassette domain-containing protein, partial [Candidatus Desulfacyla sp.]